ncbi:MAG: CHAP domain-containing protein [Alphaproteobacteria bacterium]|nr:CHAP domain-containing protein [Alphaproteobacteria bacterium]
MRKLILTIALALAPLSAQADVLDFAGRQLDALHQSVDHKLGAVWNFLGSSQPETGIEMVESTPMVWIAPAPRQLDAKVAPPQLTLAAADMTMPRVPAPRVVRAPSVEKADKRLFCVEYARALSGLSIFGDAKYWWDRAKNLYSRASRPLEEAVMVFAGSSRLKRGHLAVVSQIVSAREIRVEQANWLNKGEIDHDTPVLDVSDKNDWSRVRVWDVPSRQFGSRVYAISGFILNPAERLAANN